MRFFNFFSVVFAFFMTVSVSLAQPGANGNKPDYYKAGKLYDEGNYKAAAKIYSDALKQYPEAENYYSRALCYYQMRKYKKALKDCEQAAKYAVPGTDLYRDINWLYDVSRQQRAEQIEKRTAVWTNIAAGVAATAVVVGAIADETSKDKKPPKDGKKDNGKSGHNGGKPNQNAGQNGGKPNHNGGKPNQNAGQNGGKPNQNGGKPNQNAGQNGGKPGHNGGKPGQKGGQNGGKPGHKGGKPGQKGGQNGGKPGKNGG